MSDLASSGVLEQFAEAGLWPGLGRTLAARLAEAGITEAAHVTAERLVALPGVAGMRAQRLAEAFTGAADTFDVAALLVPAGLPARLAGRAVAVLGPGTAARLSEDPWALLELTDAGTPVTVEQADRLGRHLHAAGRLSGDVALRRGRGLAVAVLAEAAREGSTAATSDDVEQALARYGVRDSAGAIRAACNRGRLVADPPLLALARYAVAEQSLAGALGRLVRTARPFCDPAAVRAVAAGLDAAQQAAVAAAMTEGVSLLTGGPGTGKSRTVAAVVRLAASRRKRVLLAAPTGRAAKRLEELADAPAATLHRTLGATGRTGGAPQFTRGPDNPLDTDLLVVDEASMLDVELAAATVAACADGVHVLVVGDPEQLPSIGPGRVLADLIEAGLPRTELRTLYRQAEGGTIARLATAVRGGALPPVADATREVVLVATRGSQEAALRTVQLVTDSIPRVLGIPAVDVQVVTPVHRGPAGTAALNAALKAQLNPGDGEHAGFDAGDRVVATANHLDLAEGGFANGEVGVVIGPGPSPAGSASRSAGRGLLVAFTGSGPVEVPAAATGDLTLGWAITVHRAQGSEWPAVVCVLPPEAAGMASRPLVYTAFTRAARHLSVVHSTGGWLERAVAQVGARPRRTRLAALLRGALPGAGGQTGGDTASGEVVSRPAG